MAPVTWSCTTFLMAYLESIAPMTKTITPEQRRAIEKLFAAYKATVRSLYGLPKNADVERFVESEKAPEKLRAEYAEFRELMAEL